MNTIYCNNPIINLIQYHIGSDQINSHTSASTSPLFILKLFLAHPQPHKLFVGLTIPHHFTPSPVFVMQVTSENFQKRLKIIHVSRLWCKVYVRKYLFKNMINVLNRIFHGKVRGSELQQQQLLLAIVEAISNSVLLIKILIITYARLEMSVNRTKKPQ